MLQLARGGASTPRFILSPTPPYHHSQLCCAAKVWCTAVGHQHGPRLQPIPGMSAWPLVVTWATDIDTNRCHCMTMDPDVTVSSSLGRDFMASDGGAGYSQQAIPRLSRPTSLHSAQIILLLFLSHLHHTLAHCSGSHCVFSLEGLFLQHVENS